MSAQHIQVLIVEDSDDMRDLMQLLLVESGYETLTAADGREALKYIEDDHEFIDLVITDVQMPEVTGHEILGAVRARRGETPVIVITAFGSVEQAVSMVKSGAFQYLTKPFNKAKLLSLVEKALESSAPHREQARLRRELPITPAKIIGASKPMRELFEQVAKVARSMSTVLITGESGTGKELVARAIHDTSGRGGAFVPVNCAAIPSELIESEFFGHTGGAFTGAKGARPGLFEAADGGTIFLDEIGELPLMMQPKLLRVLQDSTVRRIGADRERTVKVRVVVATNRDLETEVRDGKFREDLYWRLNVIQLSLPPLRKRPFDIPLLIEHFVARYAEASGSPPLEVSAEALAILTAYSWPGNVRELENVIERAVAMTGGAVLMPDGLPDRLRSGNHAASVLNHARESQMTLRQLEQTYVAETLRRAGGNKSRAAEMLGLDRKTLYRKLEECREAGLLDEL
ncbi:MAG TPA: sigma-54 dependent transcriptional regulator [Blastocatellia bacterium]|nr:sigma-54 dependent transcriptional regulator [Blastocatellia bacterium]